jgi:hypothetical protein
MFAAEPASYGIQLTISSAVALLLLDRAVVILKAWRGPRALNGNGTNGGKSGDMPVSYWKLAHREALDAALDERLIPVLQAQTNVLKEIREGQVKTNERLGELLVRARVDHGE